ncbi:MAG: hypothetical protein M3459_10770 [Actinomycetota bacterium]|nr:hypothetical protein [Actinomycetota bacterium]
MADEEILREIATHVARTNELAEESRLQQREIRTSMDTVNHGLAQVVVVLRELGQSLRDDREAFLGDRGQFLEALRRDRADFVAELRAHREALFRILDRLPPPPEPS